MATTLETSKKYDKSKETLSEEMRYILENVMPNINIILKKLNEKANLDDLNLLSESSKKYATSEELESLSENINSKKYATSEELELLSEGINTKKYVTAADLECLSESISNKKYATAEDLHILGQTVPHKGAVDELTNSVNICSEKIGGLVLALQETAEKLDAEALVASDYLEVVNENLL